jgi:hypothetical protein
MTAAQVFILLLACLFVWAAFSTVQYGMIRYFAMFTAVLWLGIGVGLFIRTAIEAWK